MQLEVGWTPFSFVVSNTDGAYSLHENRAAAYARMRGRMLNCMQWSYITRIMVFALIWLALEYR